ncbi:MAG: hypothetical protein HYZ53_02670 [Planctomycetes bacterium]|nr:hypothetical protein [Planctomycetota bacterium]
MRQPSPKAARDARPRLAVPTLLELDPYWEEWLRLTPAQRLARSWALRRRLPDLQAVHDAKLFPKP